MTKDEALKMVIDNLELQDFNTVNATLIAYCKEALAQPAQEPVAFRNKTTGEFCTSGFEAKHLDQWTPLYTNPAPSWQKLSDDEIDAVWFEVVKENNFEGAGKYFARAIEQALKEKNT